MVGFRVFGAPQFQPQKRESQPWGSPKASYIKANQPHFPRFRVRIFRILRSLEKSAKTRQKTRKYAKRKQQGKRKKQGLEGRGFSAFSALLLCGISSNPYFSGVRGTVRIFRIFAVSGMNRWLRKSDRPALLWQALGDRETTKDPASHSRTSDTSHCTNRWLWSHPKHWRCAIHIVGCKSISHRAIWRTHLVRLFFWNNLARQKRTSTNKNDLARLFGACFKGYFKWVFQNNLWR